MATLDELIFYCRLQEPVGAMALLGESGSGKTHLIENDLKEALRDTHVIVRISLFGVDSLSTLHDAVKKKWLAALIPVRSRKELSSEERAFGKGFIKAANSILKIVVPRAGTIGNAALSIMDDFEILPRVEDIHSKTIKQVILVFDDTDRALMNRAELLGAINDYCENRHFHVILVTNNEFVNAADPQNEDLIRSAKEKTVAYTLYNHPDYGTIIHSLIADRTWKSEEYAEFLRQHEQTVIALFGTETADKEQAGKQLSRCQNLRSLLSALESFYRIHYYLTAARVADHEPYLCGFLPFYLAEKGGVRRNGSIQYSFSEEELLQLYPRFSPDHLFLSVRRWIKEGYWDKAQFLEELARATGH